MHVVSHYYEQPNVISHIKTTYGSWSNLSDISLINATLPALLNNALNKIKEIRNTSWPERIKKSMDFAAEFFEIFPKASVLMNLYLPILYSVNRERVFRSWKNLDDYIIQANNTFPDCFGDYFPTANFHPITDGENESNFNDKLQQQLRERNNSDLTAFSECRMDKVIILLTQLNESMKHFPKFALKNQRTLQETILWCRWLDGGNCVYEEVSSDMGVKCFKDASEQFRILQQSVAHVDENESQDIIESNYPQLHNRQKITYKIDQGYSRVRLFNYKVSDKFKERKQRQRDDLSKKVQKMGNDAFLPIM
ncbi:hypothetical protein Ddc_17590 [Ditylenchus destructor]|nr:hypothetical protein Ddc_17590 [Ditylenchus destructor]